MILEQKVERTLWLPYRILLSALFQPFSCYDIMFRERKTRPERQTLIMASTENPCFRDQGDRLQNISFLYPFYSNKTNLLFLS